MSQQIRLTWDNHISNMMSSFKSLLSDGAMMDVTLACDGLSLRAHKIVLSTCSSFFRSLFLENPCKHPIVILHNVKFTELQLIIEFMYCGEIVVADNQLSDLMKIAKTLMVKGLGEVMRETVDESADQPVSGSPPSSKQKTIKIERQPEIDNENDLPRQSNQVPGVSDEEGQFQSMHAFCESIMAVNHQLEISPVMPSKDTGDKTHKPPSNQSGNGASEQKMKQPYVALQKLSDDFGTRCSTVAGSSASPVPKSEQPAEISKPKQNSDVGPFTTMLKELITSPGAPYAIILPRQSGRTPELSETLVQPERKADHSYSVPLTSTPKLLEILTQPERKADHSYSVPLIPAPKPPALEFTHQEPVNLSAATAAVLKELIAVERRKKKPAKGRKSFTTYGNKVTATSRKKSPNKAQNTVFTKPKTAAATERKNKNVVKPLPNTRTKETAKRKSDRVRDTEEIMILSDCDDNDLEETRTVTGGDAKDAEKNTTSKDNGLYNTVENITSTREDAAGSAVKTRKGNQTKNNRTPKKDSAKECSVADHRCSYCSNKLASQKSLVKHMKNVHKRFFCSQCQFTAKLRLQLNMHKAKVHGMKTCGSCNFSTEDDSVLKRHMKRVHNKDSKTYKCVKCGYSADSKRILDIHSNAVHSNDKKSAHVSVVTELSSVETVQLENGT